MHANQAAFAVLVVDFIWGVPDSIVAVGRAEDGNVGAEEDAVVALDAGTAIEAALRFGHRGLVAEALVDLLECARSLFRRKVGAAVVAVRRAGSIHVFNSINHFFLINQMIVPGSIYWNMGIGRNPGEVGSDEEGIATMKALGENMAWLLKRIDARR